MSWMSRWCIISWKLIFNGGNHGIQTCLRHQLGFEFWIAMGSPYNKDAPMSVILTHDEEVVVAVISSSGSKVGSSVHARQDST